MHEALDLEAAPITRRNLMKGIGAATVAATLLPRLETQLPPAFFDPVEYIADMRAAGVGVSLHADSYMLTGPFRDGFFQVSRKWNGFMEPDADYIEKVVAVLSGED